MVLTLRRRRTKTFARSLCQVIGRRMSDYIAHLAAFVDREYDAQKAQVYEMWRRSVGQRVAEGEAIAHVEVAQVLGNLALRLRIKRFTRALDEGVPPHDRTARPMPPQRQSVSASASAQGGTRRAARCARSGP